MSLTPGQVVEFTGKESELCLGIVLSVTSKGVRVLGLNRKETTVTERNVQHSGKSLKCSLNDLDACVSALQATQARRETIASEIDLEELHGLLADDPRPYQVAEMAGFLADGTDDDVCAALLRKLSNDHFYFRARKEGFTPISPAEVEAAKKREALRLQQEQDERALVEEIKNIWQNPSQPLPDRLQKLIEPLVQVLLFNEEAPNAKKLLEALQKAGITGEKKLFQWLTKIGRLKPDENLLLLKYKVPSIFSEAAQAEVEIIASGNLPVPPADLRDLPCWVIDNGSTRDRDDGFSIRREEDGTIRLWVHIVDAAGAISPGSALDQEALRRGTTLYLADGNISMLPPRLSEDLLSLNQGAERRTLTQEILFSPTGEILGHTIQGALVRVREAISYEEAETRAAEPDLTLGLNLADLLKKRRKAAGALIMPQKPEVRVYLENGVLGLSSRDRENPAQEMVAEFMIWANHLAAVFCRDNAIPCLYRIQEAPAESIAFGDAFNPVSFFRLIRGLKRSSNSIVPGLHGCLGVNPYTQITSPMRRYGDLLLQRQIRAFLGGNTPPLDTKGLQQTFLLSEGAIDTAEEIMRQRERFFLIQYLKQKVSEGTRTFDGTILDSTFSEVHVYHHLLCEFGHCRKPPFDVKTGQKAQIKFTHLDPFDLTMRFEIDSVSG